MHVAFASPFLLTFANTMFTELEVDITTKGGIAFTRSSFRLSGSEEARRSVSGITSSTRRWRRRSGVASPNLPRPDATGRAAGVGELA